MSECGNISYLSISHYIIGNDLEQGGIEKLLGNDISSLHFSLFKDITIAVVVAVLYDEGK